VLETGKLKLETGHWGNMDEVFLVRMQDSGFRIQDRRS
jgi:hypothetical protein